MGAGRPKKADPGALYAIAHQFYWDFRRIAEGYQRRRFSREKYQQLTKGLDEVQLVDDEDRARHQQIVDEEIRTGRLESSRREWRLRDIEDAEVSVRREFRRQEAAEEAQMEIKVPGERDVIKVLLDSNTTPQQVRELCRDAFMSRIVEVEPGVSRELDGFPAWPFPVGSTFPGYLSQYAEQYVEALRDPRFPHCDVTSRPSTRLKQFWFLSRALAGALFGVRTRTAINLVGSMRPEQVFYESRQGKPVRSRQRKQRQIVIRQR